MKEMNMTVKLVRASMRLAAAAALSMAADSAFAMKRPVPEYLKHATVYQIVLRNFTRDGNFKAATAMLDHVRSTGVDVVYLTPFVEMDCDMDETGWSSQQKKSGYHTPKNPYRISNYDRIDLEYGKDEDFKAFNDRVHELGMKTYMDLVYLHCGPNNVLKDMFHDAFQKNPDGTVRMTKWHFPYINFESKGVRRYLIDSMLHWIRLGCDGFRCDVGDDVPIEFWVEAVEACQAVKPDLVMINEGAKVEWLEKAFDACYAFPFSFGVRDFLTPAVASKPFTKGKTLPQMMEHMRNYEAKIPAESLMFCFMDNHDSAAKYDGENRFDRVHPVEAGNAGFVLVFLRRGLPMIFNGNEIADNSLNTFFAPVEDIGRARKTVDWGRALQPAGQKRLALIRKLAKLHSEDPIFYDGTQEWVTNGEDKNTVAFVRRLGDRAVFVAANLRPTEAAFVPEGVRLDPARRPMMSENTSVDPDGTCRLGGYGYIVQEFWP
jgi:glycosidase